MKILLFDDVQDHRQKIAAAIEQALNGKGVVQQFVPAAGGIKEGTYDERLISDIAADPNVGADLVVADRDLSSYVPEYRGLSEPTVRRAANFAGIPECGYARGDKTGDGEYIKRGEEYESCIRLSLAPDMETFAKKVVAIAEGFLDIRKSVKEVLGRGVKSPGKVLAEVLGKPEYADKIGLYAAGDQARLGSVLRVKAAPEERNALVSTLLGYWLWDSVLRFPGVTVGTVPAASYLNIKGDIFETKAVQELFEQAEYKGPFAGAKVKMWWRGMLDDIVVESGFSDGREYVANRLKADVPRSECCVDASIPAGYYCMLSKKPVSAKNSKGGLTWFPRGADLARVSIAAFEELGPWL